MHSFLNHRRIILELFLCGISLLVLSLELFFLPVTMGGMFPQDFIDIDKGQIFKSMLITYFNNGYCIPMLIPIILIIVCLTVYVIKIIIKNRR